MFRARHAAHLSKLRNAVLVKREGFGHGVLPCLTHGIALQIFWRKAGKRTTIIR